MLSLNRARAFNKVWHEVAINKLYDYNILQWLGGDGAVIFARSVPQSKSREVTVEHVDDDK